MPHLIVFLRGMYEFRRAWTWADPARTDCNGYTDLDETYDRGRDCAHRLTFRVFDRP